MGIKDNLLQGEKWNCIEHPPGNPLKQISVNTIGVWAVSRKGNLYVRKDISHSWPEGSCWQSINVDPLITGIFLKLFCKEDLRTYVLYLQVLLLIQLVLNMLVSEVKKFGLQLMAV